MRRTRLGNFWSIFASPSTTSLHSQVIPNTSLRSGRKDTGHPPKRRPARLLGTRVLQPFAATDWPLTRCFKRRRTIFLSRSLTAKVRLCCGKPFLLHPTTRTTWANLSTCARCSKQQLSSAVGQDAIRRVVQTRLLSGRVKPKCVAHIFKGGAWTEAAHESLPAGLNDKISLAARSVSRPFTASKLHV